MKEGTNIRNSMIAEQLKNVSILGLELMNNRGINM